MPIWVRAIIFGLEIVSFLIFCTFTVIKEWKGEKEKNGELAAKRELKFNIKCCIIYFILDTFCAAENRKEAFYAAQKQRHEPRCQR